MISYLFYQKECKNCELFGLNLVSIWSQIAFLSEYLKVTLYTHE
jgi:hypothetical protein